MSENTTIQYAWPEADGCVSLLIEKTVHIDGSVSVSTISIDSQEEIQTFFSLLHTLPTRGDLFVSFSPLVDVVSVAIVYESEQVGKSPEYVNIYGGKVKLPDTTILANDAELHGVHFVEYVESLLQKQK
jgi:hypothetical protein